MARLSLIYNILDGANKVDMRQRQYMRRMARYMEKDFSMSDVEFKQNYNISKDIYELVCGNLEPLMKKPSRRSEISPRSKILVALSFYATGGYQRMVGDYGTMMSQQSVSRALKDVTAALNSEEIRHKWLKFPQTQEERNAIKTRFYDKYRIPSVLGCLSSTHIAIVRPSQNDEIFYNSNGYHSRIVLFICDADHKILSVDSSFGGAAHDSSVWSQHPVKEYLTSLNNTGERAFLLGDSSYPQSESLMIPIIDAQRSSPEEYYNELHGNAHSTVGKTIGLLKMRWKCLDKVLHYHPDTAAKIIDACCVLHNMCLSGRLYGDMENLLSSVTEEVRRIPNDNEEVAFIERSKGIEIRTIFLEELWASRGQ